jgi:predicted ATPase/class 3 adenylate cyclase/DNA-binding CsgD family transcriptional regulator
VSKAVGRRDRLAELPRGTVTFLLTDIEGSTRLWQSHPDAMGKSIRRHDDVVGSAIEQNHGVVLKDRGEGDSFFAVFARASNAVAAACSIQRALLREDWPNDLSILVRIAIHTGEAQEESAPDYRGTVVNRCARLRALARGGQVVLSSSVRELVRDNLPAAVSLKDLGEQPLRDLERPEHVFQILDSTLPADLRAIVRNDSAKRAPNNLPAQFTSFIGRQEQMVELRRLLGGVRLVTLSGAGGCGKTRLALEVAGALTEEYAEGVWFVELAPLIEASLVPQTVASVIRVREEPGRSILQVLCSSLESKRVLLLLDNCEHLISAAAELADALLRACPHLTILATSREPLNLPGEHSWHVAPLSLPNFRGALSMRSLGQVESVRLFVDRARLAEPTFSLTDRNAALVAEVCQRLDGIPLAVELAAAQVRHMPVTEILARLQDRFQVLATSARKVEARHQTLRATMDWGYDLLSQTEQTLFRRLSVFVGGFGLHAAQAVCSGDGIEMGLLLNLLSGLVDKSLLVAEEGTGGAAWYRLLETVREYGRARLVENEEAELMRRRHGQFFVAFAQEAEQELKGPRQGAWLRRLEEEHDNLRAALEWSLRADPNSALSLASSIAWFCEVRAHWTEGLGWLADALEASSDRGILRARALIGAGSLALRREGSVVGPGRLAEGSSIESQPRRFRGARSYFMESLAMGRQLDDSACIARSLISLGEAAGKEQHYDEARSQYEAGLAVARQSADRQAMAFGLRRLANLAAEENDLPQARPLFEESLAISRELGDAWGIAFAVDNLGHLAVQLGDYVAACRYHEETLGIWSDLVDPWGIAHAHANLGIVFLAQGDAVAAQARFEESLEMERKLGLQLPIADLLRNLGDTALEQADSATARRRYEESLAIWRGHGDKLGMALGLEGVAQLAAARSQPQRALLLAGAASAIYDAIGIGPGAPRKLRLERWLKQAEQVLGQEASDAVRAEGRTMTPERAADLALGLEGPARDQGQLAALPGRPGSTRLTRREQEVARLVARGRTNRQIAKQLFVAERTVDTHVEHIRDKLDVHSRAEIAAWVTESGLGATVD